MASEMVDAGAKHENWHSYHDVRKIYGAMNRAALKEDSDG